MGEMRNTYNYGQKTEEKELLVRLVCKWENNIRMYIKRNRVGSCGLDTSGSGYGPVVGSYKHNESQVP
jgi:hypothetical protein